MEKGCNMRQAVRAPHLPPFDTVLLLAPDAKGKAKATDKITVPLDGYGVPDPEAYLKLLLSTVEESYVWPNDDNVHHLAYPRHDYHNAGENAVEYRYRETPSIMMRLAKQLHNYGHAVTIPPPMPNDEVMIARVEEQTQINKLFKLGRQAISSERWEYEMMSRGTYCHRLAMDYIKQNNQTAQAFYDYLEQCRDAQVGLMPDRGELYEAGIHEATRRLGVLAAARSLDYRRDSRSQNLMFGSDILDTWQHFLLI